MKIPAKLFKTCRCAYLYADGHMVMVHEKKDVDAGRVEWVTLHENIGVKCDFEGRLIISGCWADSAAIHFVASCQRIRVRPATIKGGSENTRKANIPVGYIGFNFGHGYVTFSQFSTMVSDDFTLQTDKVTTWDEVKGNTRWSDYPVSHVYAEPKPAVSDAPMSIAA